MKFLFLQFFILIFCVACCAFSWFIPNLICFIMIHAIESVILLRNAYQQVAMSYSELYLFALNLLMFAIKFRLSKSSGMILFVSTSFDWGVKCVFEWFFLSIWIRGIILMVWHILSINDERWKPSRKEERSKRRGEYGRNSFNSRIFGINYINLIVQDVFTLRFIHFLSMISRVASPYVVTKQRTKKNRARQKEISPLTHIKRAFLINFAIMNYMPLIGRIE